MLFSSLILFINIISHHHYSFIANKTEAQGSGSYTHVKPNTSTVAWEGIQI